jgi:hypothetical protein
LSAINAGHNESRSPGKRTDGEVDVIEKSIWQKVAGKLDIRVSTQYRTGTGLVTSLNIKKMYLSIFLFFAFIHIYRSNKPFATVSKAFIRVNEDFQVIGRGGWKEGGPRT